MNEPDLEAPRACKAPGSSYRRAEGSVGIGTGASKVHRSLPGGRLGRLLNGCYWASSGRTLAAWAPLGPAVTSNSTAWPSSSER